MSNFSVVDYNENNRVNYYLREGEVNINFTAASNTSRNSDISVTTPVLKKRRKSASGGNENLVHLMEKATNLLEETYTRTPSEHLSDIDAYAL